MQEIKEVITAPAEQVEEIKSSAQDEIVALYCSLKEGSDPDADSQLEVSRGGYPFFTLRANQFKRMSRKDAQWYVGKASRHDITNPLQLSLVAIAELEMVKQRLQAEKNARADRDAQAKKDAEAAAAKADAEAAKVAEIRMAHVNSAIEAGAIEKHEDADMMTNADLLAATKAKKA